jgi:hypothetical protein
VKTWKQSNDRDRVAKKSRVEQSRHPGLTAISAATETRLLLPPVTRTTGVWPRRPQVRPLGGRQPHLLPAGPLTRGQPTTVGIPHASGISHDAPAVTRDHNSHY